MTDYNRKFRELNLKISQAVKDNKNINNSIEQYNKRLNKIEENSLKKLKALENSYSYIKNEFSKIVSIYHNIKQLEKRPLNEREINSIINDVNFNLKKQRKESIEYIQSIFSNVERTISKINDNDFYEKNKFTNECNNMKEIIDNNMNDCENILQNKNYKINQILEDLKESSEKELENVNKLLEKEIYQQDFNSNKLNKDLNDLNDKIEEKFLKTKQSLNDFEENIFNLVDETCLKLTQP